MSDDIVLSTLEENQALSRTLSTSDFMVGTLKKRPDNILAIVLTGRELGMGPMQSIRGIHIINGKPTLAADTMGALVKRSPVCQYLYIKESTDKVCTYVAKRVNDPGDTTLSFSIEQAKRAGLLSNPTWSKYPDAMLRARCLSAICRAVFPDLVMGLYDPEELGTERDITPRAEHVSSYREALKAEVIVVTPRADIEAAIAKAPSVADLEALIPSIKHLSTEDIAALKTPFNTRKAELEKQNDAV